MFPVYPLLVLASAISMSEVARAVDCALDKAIEGSSSFGRRGRWLPRRWLLLAVLVLLCAALSAMRTAALVCAVPPARCLAARAASKRAPRRTREKQWHAPL